MEMDEDLLEAHRHDASDDIKKFKIYTKSGVWAESPYLDMLLSICRITFLTFDFLLLTFLLLLLITGKCLRAHQKCIGK